MEWIHTMPKIELHAHLNGSIRDSTLLELARNLREKGVTELADVEDVIQKNDRSLDEVFKLFDLIHVITTDHQTVTRITREVVQDFALENVVYLELRTTPKRNDSIGMSKRSYMEAVIKGLRSISEVDVEFFNSQQPNKSCGRKKIYVRLLLSIDRRETTESAMETVKLALEMRNVAAFDLFHELHDKDGVTWTVMISGLVRNELFAEAASLLSDMMRHGLKPLNSTYSVLLSSAGATSNLDQGKHLHCVIAKTTACYDPDLILQNSLVSMYAKCGAIDDAYEIFSKMLRKDTVSWNSMIMGLSHHGLADKVLSLFKEMLDSEMKPNSVTFLAVLSACSHSGLITRGLELFKAMKETYSIQPGVEHYISMIDLLGRAGKLREAEEFISTLPFTPDHTVYGALLGLCGLNWRDRDAEGIAKRAAMRLLELDPVNAPGHVALCNVYAGLGKHELEKEMRKEMGVKGVKKTPGCSWIVVNGKSNVFLSGDKSACEVAQMSLPIFCSNGMLEEEEEKVLTLCHC